MEKKTGAEIDILLGRPEDPVKAAVATQLEEMK